MENFISLVDKASEIFSHLSMDKATHYSSQLSERIRKDKFRLAVVGSFKNGKSTFVNALLGDAILPAYALPCTAVISEIKYGRRSKATLHFQSSIPNESIISVPSDIRQHILKYRGENVPSFDIPIDKLEDYIVIPLDNEDPKQGIIESPYEKVEIFAPSRLLKNGLEIIDTPGLNEHKTRTELTINYLSNVDAIVFLMRADQILSEVETSFIDKYLYGNVFDNVFYVINRFDLIPEVQKQKFRSVTEKQIKSCFKSDKVFFVSAQLSLEGILEKNETKRQTSEMQGFENELLYFLLSNKIERNLRQPTAALIKLLKDEAIETVIPNSERLLRCSIDDIIAKQDTIANTLDSLRAILNRISDELRNEISEFHDKAVILSYNHSKSVADKIEGWVKECTPVTNLFVFASKTKVQAYVNEVTSSIKDKIESEYLSWRRTEIEPAVSKERSVLEQLVSDDLKDYYSILEDLYVALGKDESIRKNDFAFVPVVQQGYINNLLTYSPGVSNYANSVGYSALVCAISLGAAIASLSFPFVLVQQAIFGILCGGAGMASLTIKSNVNLEIANSLSQELLKNAEANAHIMAERIKADFTLVSNNIIESFQSEINEIETQTRKILSDIVEGQKAKDERLRQLSLYRSQSQQLIQELGQLLSD